MMRLRSSTSAKEMGEKSRLPIINTQPNYGGKRGWDCTHFL
jgi:hypothetical protein